MQIVSGDHLPLVPCAKGHDLNCGCSNHQPQKDRTTVVEAASQDVMAHNLACRYLAIKSRKK
jgi:hypothetical protein